MLQHRLSPTVLLVFLATAIFLTATVALMLSPLLVELAHEFHTSVAVTGQLAAATAVTWGLTAFLAGPVSDTYGRRLMILLGLLLMTLGTLSSALAWNYNVLLACRFLIGMGAALIPANSLATVADILPQEQRGKAMGWLISASGLGTAFGIPLVALLSDVGGWRLPLYVVGTFLLLVWVLLWVWFPSSQRSQAVPFVAHVREVAARTVFWYVLAANCLQVMAFMGMSGYLAAYLQQSYRMTAGETALPLTLAGLGVVAGSLLGGRVASHAHRLSVLVLSFAGGGLMVALVFTTHLSPWMTVGLAFGVSALLLLSWPVTALLLTEVAGQSRATAMGMFAVSNQLGIMGGGFTGGPGAVAGALSLGGCVLYGDRSRGRRDRPIQSAGGWRVPSTCSSLVGGRDGRGDKLDIDPHRSLYRQDTVAISRRASGTIVPFCTGYAMPVFASLAENPPRHSAPPLRGGEERLCCPRI